jgi:Fe-S cluster biosynthesis and repair protein YggX
MTHIVHCLKLKRDAEGLTQPPMPGELGQKIYDSISKEAWQLWLQHQTMLINEYRLSMIDPKSRVFLLDEMQKFLFGDGSEKPAGYTPKNSSSA